MFSQKIYALEFRAATQSTDMSGGQINKGRLKVSTRVIPKSLALGKLEVGKPSGSNQKFACDYLKVEVDNETVLEIDKINILNASFLAMHRALDQLSLRPEAVIVDGNRFRPYQDLPFTTIVKGDGKYLSIAAASVLAKTYRDDYMLNLAKEYPQYDWQSNMGYPTKKHRQAIRDHGITPYHRKSYNLLGDGQLSFDF